ncbi:hypothetical protein [Chelativorans xinjiangense]|uniref:hypothetical protein n=1 Tax=Chelativorans xinjiangense TaxID=2681485 RepID=UPI00135B9FD9|nr:hypothetical protein [Chelativorans xinjiangense]
MLAKLKGWRTLIANALMAILPIMELTEFRDVLPDVWVPYYALFVVLANMWLRKITTTPVGERY